LMGIQITPLAHHFVSNRITSHGNTPCKKEEKKVPH